MKTAKLVIGLLLTICSSLYLLLYLVAFLLTTCFGINNVTFPTLITPIIILTIGIFLIVSANKKEKSTTYVQHQYTEEERKIYFRNANAHGKPITEYQMDERTKMITYYDRMPYSYKKKLSDYADTLYRRYENEEYLKK